MHNGKEADGTPTRDRLKLMPRVVNVDEWAQSAPLSGPVLVLSNLSSKHFSTLSCTLHCTTVYSITVYSMSHDRSLQRVMQGPLHIVKCFLSVRNRGVCEWQKVSPVFPWGCVCRRWGSCGVTTTSHC